MYFPEDKKAEIVASVAGLADQELMSLLALGAERESELFKKSLDAGYEYSEFSVRLEAATKEGARRFRDLRIPVRDRDLEQFEAIFRRHVDDVRRIAEANAQAVEARHECAESAKFYDEILGYLCRECSSIPPEIPALTLICHVVSLLERRFAGQTISFPGGRE